MDLVGQILESFWAESRTQRLAPCFVSSWSVQVIGQSKGRPFVVPISYAFQGSTVAQGLHSEIQRAEYIRKHQIARGQNLKGSKHLTHISINCGKSFALFPAGDGAELKKCLLTA